MKSLSLRDILMHVKGDIIQGNENLIIKNVVTKPNRLKNNTLLFHFTKRKIDWNLHIFNQSNVIVTGNPFDVKKYADKNVTIVKVNNINQAYWEFVHFYRNLFQIPVIGVTGTCGKTTTTEMINMILSKNYKVQSTFDGKNGLSQNLSYLLGIDDSIDAAVFELGVDSPGCIQFSCKYFQPQIGVLLNIGTYHLLHCKTLDNYIKAKAELLEGLAFKGTLILNSDDKNIKKIDLNCFKGKIIYFGFNDESQFQAKNIRYVKEGMKFNLHFQNETYQFYVPGYGEQNVYNTLAAIAASHAAGVDIKEASECLVSFKPVRRHLQFKSGINGCTVIDDTWNCNPPSMECALKVLKAMANSRKTIAVLGYMPQLGVTGYDEYSKIGEKVIEAGIGVIITIGDEAKQIGIEALQNGFDKNNVYFCKNATDLYEVLNTLLDKDTLVLFKFPYKYRLSKDASFKKFMKKIFE